MRKMFSVLLVVCMILSLTSIVFAAASPNVDEKVNRGSKNLLLGWTDIPKNIVDTSKRDKNIAAPVIGTVKGFFQAVARTVSGAVDIVTSPIGKAEKPAINPTMVPEVVK